MQVPITVYREGKDFVLIDGERRWRCSSKLNKKTIPALIQPKPDPLQNLLLMFNIHSLREQWDLVTIALKLPMVIGLLRQSLGKEPKEAELSNETGLSRSVIRRCRILMELPQKYKDMLLAEVKKPKNRQVLSEDFFIEMEKALRTIERAMPDVFKEKDDARDALIRKYKDKKIANITDLRMLPKIARAGKVGADIVQAREALTRVFTDRDYTVEAAFGSTVSSFYAERDLLSRIETLTQKLSDSDDPLDDDLRERLGELVEAANRLLETD